MTLLKSLIALTFLIFITQNTSAEPKDCMNKLMSTHHSPNNDTYIHNLHLDDIDRNFGKDYLADAIYKVRLILKKVGCSKEDINFGKGPYGKSQSRCTNILRDQEHTRVCYVESNLGYFFLTTDLLDNINILYSRWD